MNDAPRMLSRLVLSLAIVAPVLDAQLDPMLPLARVPLLPASFTPDGASAVADVDLDGLPDLLLLCWDHELMDPFLAVLRALPEGGYAPAEAWAAKGSGHLRAADLDGNGWPDVALMGNHHVHVLYGVGEGDFLSPAAYFVGAGWLSDLELADVDRDARLDLVTSVTTPDGGPLVAVNFADAGGGFLATQVWPAAESPRDLACGDLDGDGWVDAVLVSQSSSTLQVLLGDGAGGFGAPVSQACDTAPVLVLLGRLDGDGDLDAVVVAEGPFLASKGTTRAFLNDGAGGLLPAGLVTAGKQNTDALLHDADADGDLDVLLVDNAGSTLYALAGDGAGDLALAARLPLGLGPRAALAADATRDGHDDLLLACQDQPDLVLIPARADGALALPPTCGLVPVPTDGALADLDGDGWLDLLFCGWSNETVATALGSPDGLLPDLLLHPQLLAWDNDLVALADLTGDGLPDAVVEHSDPDTELVVGPGLGDGTFGAPLDAPYTSAGTVPSALALLDLDQDGWRDALLLSPGPAARLDSFLNQGPAQPGQLGAPGDSQPGAGTAHMALGDTDFNGTVDAVVTREPAALGLPWTLAVLSGEYDGSFGPDTGVDLPDLASPVRAVVLADFDLDGDLDTAVGCEGGEVVLARGTGGGGMLPESPLAAPVGASHLAACDLDGDGWIDLVQAGTGKDQSFAVRRGDGSGGLAAPVLHAGSGQHVRLLVADMDRDDRPDIVSLSDDVISPHRGHVRTYLDVRRRFAWTDLQHAKAGSLGEPRTTGTGLLEPGTPGMLRLGVAAPFAPALLVVSPTEAALPWKGGVLVPLTEFVLAGPVTDPLGQVVLTWDAWPSIGSGVSLALQFAVADPGAQGGVSLGNALRATEAD